MMCAAIALAGLSVRGIAEDRTFDFGAYVHDQLAEHSEQLFGFRRPLTGSALGPYDGPDNLEAIAVAPGLRVSLVSSAVASAADQIALWPNDRRPRYAFICDEETSTPAVQRVDLSAAPASNATTIVTGLSSCDPVRRTPWGTILVGEENGIDGGLYEIIDPVHVTSPISVTNRATGETSDSLHLVKRKAVGLLSWEAIAVEEDGTLIYADELAPSNGNAGGGIYKFVPEIRYEGGGPIIVPAQSPLTSGNIYGLRVAASKSSNWGQGAETGKGAWVAVNLAGSGVVDGNQNVVLRTAQGLQKFTGYYRPEDMDVDPIAREDGILRACWANTGRKSHTADSIVENSAVQSEVMCLVENPPTANDPTPVTGTIPTVDRFLTGSSERAMFDNVAFQPHSGNLVVLEDGPVNVTKSLQPSTTELRGNDLWICLPDGADDDALSDGCVRFASIRDTTAEPSGFIFLGSGEEALVHIQHRAVNDAAGAGSHGALVKISGFRVHRGDRDVNDSRGRREYDDDRWQ
jgi:secreted PhoX family phosphatase